MAKLVKDTLVRKYEAKECYFEGNKLMAAVKDEDPIEIDLIKDLKDFFKDNEFNIAVQMKSESTVAESDVKTDDESEDEE